MKKTVWFIGLSVVFPLIFQTAAFTARPPLGEAILRQHKNAPAQTPSLPSPSMQEAANKEFFEAHWHGLELIYLTPQLAQVYKIPAGTPGLLVDEVTLEAAGCGFLAGDIVQSVEGYPTPTLKDFLKGTIQVQKRRQAKIQIFRQGTYLTIPLIAADYYRNLGYANMDGAPPIKPGAISPHKNRNKACTACHLIMKSGGQLPTDAGDIVPIPPPITLDAPAPHRYRGSCNSCHQIIPKDTARAPQSPINFKGKQAAKPLTLGEAIRRQRLESELFTAGANNTRPLNDAQGRSRMFNEALIEPEQRAIISRPAAQTLPVNDPAELNLHHPAAVSPSTASSSNEEPVAWMGLEMVSVNEAIAEQYELTGAHGVLVNKVEKRSPAATAGLKPGDILTDVGNIKITDSDSLVKIVSVMMPGDEAELSLLRGGKQYMIPLFLGERPSPVSMLKLKMFLVVLVFFIVYFLIFQEIFGHLPAFLLGSGLILYLGDYYDFYSIENALQAVNYSILIFIIGMNLISAVLREAGFFNYVAKKITLFTRGDRWKILLLFSVLTYVISCFMDNIATILMMVPMTLAMAKDLDFDPKPILVCQIISSNIGGASTMMGDFPNMLISLSTEIQFHDFIMYEMPVCIICLIALLIYFKISQKKFFDKKSGAVKGAAFFTEIKKGLKSSITNKPAVTKGLIVLGIVVTGMVLSGKLGINPAVIAFTGGIVLLMICGMNRLKIIQIVGIKDVVFFACLFVMVGAAEASGILQLLARVILDISGGSVLLITLLMMWLAAAFGAFMNAGPTAALFIPVVMHLGIKPPHYLFWWGLSLGILAGSSCFLTSASGGPLASTLVSKFWKKHKKDLDKESPLYNLKKALSFREYAKMGVPVMLLILIISSIYLTALYLI